MRLADALLICRQYAQTMPAVRVLLGEYEQIKAKSEK
jgi:hypothetical protein